MRHRYTLLGPGAVAAALLASALSGSPALQAQDAAPPTTAPAAEVPGAERPDIPKVPKVKPDLKDKLDKEKDKEKAVTVLVVDPGPKAKAKLQATLDPRISSAKLKVKDIEALIAEGDFAHIEEEPILDIVSNPNTAAHIGQSATQGAGYDGTGTVVGVLDSGTDVTHVDLDDRIQSQACFDSQWATCPGGTTSSTTSGGTPCSQPNAPTRCNHGTLVAGNIVSTHATHPGVAPDARIVSVRVFPTGTFANSNDGGVTGSNVINGLAHLRNLKASGVNIVAVNLSLGDAANSLHCSGSSFDVAYTQTWNAGISVVAAAGNEGYQNGVSSIGCSPRAFTVGALVGDDHADGVLQNGGCTQCDGIASYSNVGPMVDVFSPADTISTQVGGNYAFFNGTSSATPLVAGAVAALAEARPGTSTADREYALRNSSVLIKDTRNGADGHGRYRLNLPDALARIVERATYSAGSYNPLTPMRAWDNRNSIGGLYIGQVGPGQTWLNVSEAVGVAAGNLEAVTLNLTAVAPSATTYFKAYPNGVGTNHSNLNAKAGEVIANQVVVKVASDGYIVVENCCANTTFVVDIMGVWGNLSDLSPLTPTRIASGTVGPNTSTFVDPRGLGGVPASGVSSVVLSVAATQLSGQWGHLEIVASDAATGGTSLQNYTGNETVAAMVVAKLGPDGRFKVYNAAGNTTVDLDVMGYFATGSTDLVPINPVRVMDNPVHTGPSYAQIGNIRAAAGLPASAKAVVLNLTGVAPNILTHLSGVPGPSLPASPQTSNLNIHTGDVLANTVTLPIGSDGHVRVWNNGGTMRDIADVLAYTQ